MHLFTGLDLAPHVVKSIREYVEEVRAEAAIRWSPVANLHITTKFIGEWPESRLEELKAKLPARPGSFEVTVKGLGFFPNAWAPRSFWAGIEANPELTALAQETESALAELGIPKEKRPYSPHLTLARIASPMGLNHLLGRAPETFGSFTVDAYHLYLSRNSMYTKLATFR